jgi:hypothetical protein
VPGRGRDIKLSDARPIPLEGGESAINPALEARKNLTAMELNDHNSEHFVYASSAASSCAPILSRRPMLDVNSEDTTGQRSLPTGKRPGPANILKAEEVRDFLTGNPRKPGFMGPLLAVRLAAVQHDYASHQVRKCRTLFRTMRESEGAPALLQSGI